MDLNIIQFQNSAIGDYLFLVLIIAATIVQAIVQKKKNDEAAKAEREKKLKGELEENETYEEQFPPQEEPEGSFFDDWFKPEEVKEQEKKQVLFPPKREVSSETREVFAGEDFIRKEARTGKSSGKFFISPEEHKAELEKEYKGTPMTQKVKEDKVRKFSFKEGFNLKKAVIYSEILNKKYF